MTLNSGATGDQVAADRQLQELSANDRGPQRDANFETMPAIDGEHSAPGVDLSNLPPRDARPDPNEKPGRIPQPLSPGDQKRLDMQARFRTHREEQNAQEAEDMADLLAAQRAGMPEQDNLALEAADVRSREPEPAPPPPAKRKVVIRGQTMELTDEELIAAAQRGLAGDSYFDEARTALDKAKAFNTELDALRASVQRGTHPAAAPPVTQPTEPAPQPEEDLEHSEAYQALLHEIQFGDAQSPDLAKKFHGLIKTEAQRAAVPIAQQAASAAVAQQRENAEVARSQAVLTAFTAANPDLASDGAAMAVMERNVFDAFVEDLKAVNFDLSSVRNNSDIATIHMRMRAAGHNVRSIGDIFNGAKDTFLAWRNGGRPPAEEPPQTPPTQTQPAEPPRPAPPRIEVNVNRDVRRAAIPTQPPRTASPQRMPVIEKPQVESSEARSLVVQRMQQDRRGARNGVPIQRAGVR